MKNSQIVTLVDHDILRQFKAECLYRKTTPTKELARLMAEELERWQAERIHGRQGLALVEEGD